MLEFNNKINSLFDSFFQEVVEAGSLGDREKLVAILTASILVEDQEALKNAVLAAKKIGFTNEELGHIHALAIAVVSQKLRNLGDFKAPQPNNQSKSKCCS